jgi:hypothetical protein
MQSPSRKRRRWSQQVTRASFADRSTRRKSPPYRSAISMLTVFIIRAGKSLTAAHKKKLEVAKDELRALFSRPPKAD